MYLVCAGMVRSGSTWQYNVLSRLIDTYALGGRLGFFEKGEEFLAAMERDKHDPSKLWTVKTHARSDVWEKLCQRGQAKILYSYRDVRDVAYSVAHKLSRTMDDLLQVPNLFEDLILENDAFFTRMEPLLSMRYEEMFSNPVRSIIRIARFIDVDLDEGTAAEIEREFSMEGMRKQVNAITRHFEELGNDLSKHENTCLHDNHTQLHWNHLRTGLSGTWRKEVEPSHLQRMTELFHSWLVAHGYEVDDSWTMPKMRNLPITSHGGPAENEAKIKELMAEVAEARQAAEESKKAADRLASVRMRYRVTILEMTQRWSVDVYQFRNYREQIEAQVKRMDESDVGERKDSPTLEGSTDPSFPELASLKAKVNRWVQARGPDGLAWKLGPKVIRLALGLRKLLDRMPFAVKMLRPLHRHWKTPVEVPPPLNRQAA